MAPFLSSQELLEDSCKQACVPGRVAGRDALAKAPSWQPSEPLIPGSKMQFGFLPLRNGRKGARDSRTSCNLLFSPTLCDEFLGVRKAVSLAAGPDREAGCVCFLICSSVTSRVGVRVFLGIRKLGSLPQGAPTPVSRNPGFALITVQGSYPASGFSQEDGN